jgi:hypothetical protein
MTASDGASAADGFESAEASGNVILAPIAAPVARHVARNQGPYRRRFTAQPPDGNVSSYVVRGVDFTQYRTYAWGPADALPTGDPRLDKDPFFQDQFQGAVEKTLAERGLQQPASASATPDLLIHYHANITQRIDVNGVDRSYGYCAGGDCQALVIEHEAGTLVLDIVDTRTNRVIWRGWAQSRVDGVLGNRDRMEQRINEAVTRMLKRLPPSL